MEPAYNSNGVEIYQGDCREVLRQLPDESVHCVVTSPPYWGLRDYGCEGQIGLERTPIEYIAAMRGIFCEVQRVLRSDGTLWLNMGDCYATGAGMVGECPGGGDRGDKWKGYRGTRQSGKHEYISAARGPMTQPNRMPLPGLKPKDLVGMPWRLALALQEDGWWLRQDIIWFKPNPMPESVQDRCTKAHEYLFLLAKSERYYYNQDAIAEPAVADHLVGNSTHKGQLAYENGDERHRTKAGLVAYAQKWKTPDGWDTSRGNGGHGSIHREGREEGYTGYEHKGRTGTNAFRGQGANRDIETGKSNRDGRDMRDIGAGLTRNRRSVWEVTTQPFPEAHFATFPEDLIKPCILAGCPEGGTVLDPFMGSGTTAKVARALHCKAIGIELNPEYIRIAAKRLRQEVIDFSQVNEIPQPTADAIG